MLIFSKDRRLLADCVMVHIARNLGGGKDGKYILSGSAGFSTGGTQVLAEYADEKAAMDELEKIFSAFSAGERAYRL